MSEAEDFEAMMAGMVESLPDFHELTPETQGAIEALVELAEGAPSIISVRERMLLLTTFLWAVGHVEVGIVMSMAQAGKWNEVDPEHVVFASGVVAAHSMMEKCGAAMMVPGMAEEAKAKAAEKNGIA